jgi:hypothetical protein
MYPRCSSISGKSVLVCYQIVQFGLYLEDHVKLTLSWDLDCTPRGNPGIGAANPLESPHPPKKVLYERERGRGFIFRIWQI